VTVLIGVALALALYYTLALVIRSDWKTNTAGRAELIFSTVVSLILALVLARVLGWPAPEWLRAGIYTVIIIGLTVKALTLTTIQNRRSARLANERKEAQDAPGTRGG
jgi:undecaprenyl pyrophosphate phosphatase UppP